MTPRCRSPRWLLSCMARGSAPWAACAVLLGSVMTLGCGSDDSGADGPVPPGGQTGEETLGCQPVERDMLAWSERSALGFSADELLNALGSEVDARLAWSTSGSTPLTLGIERASGSVEFQTREFVSDGSGAEIGVPECNDAVAVPVTVSFTTADGAFAERWPVTLVAESITRVGVYRQVDVNDLEGSFTVTQVDPTRFDRVLAIFDLAFSAGVWAGRLYGQGIVEGPASNPDGTASADDFDIASF